MSLFVHLSVFIAATAQAEIVVRAQLIAYRPAEAARQVVSHVLNREVFLFLPLDRRQLSLGTIKVVQEHFGLSKLFDASSGSAGVYELVLQRKHAYDESFDSYIKNSLKLVPSETVLG